MLQARNEARDELSDGVCRVSDLGSSLNDLEPTMPGHGPCEAVLTNPALVERKGARYSRGKSMGTWDT